MADRKRYKFLSLGLLSALLLVLVLENYPQRIWQKIQGSSIESQVPNYRENWRYDHELAMFELYDSEAKIVMLGDSFISRCDWNQLLERCDVVNQGIGGDTTEGMLNRLNYVEDVDPLYCFVIGGLNDIRRGVPKDSIVQNLTAIVDSLRMKQIQPVVQSISFVQPSKKFAGRLNPIIQTINAELKEICLSRNVPFIDLNEAFSDDLNSSLHVDGVHFTPSGYLIWKDQIIRFLETEQTPPGE